MRAFALNPKPVRRAPPAGLTGPAPAPLRQNRTARSGLAVAPSATTCVAVVTRTSFRIQSRLAVDVPGDLCEQEADRVSEQVLRAVDPQSCGAHSRARGHPEGTEERSARSRSQAEHAHTDAALEGETPPIVREVLRSPGQALAAGTRAIMESRFGHDFGPVRVHTDSRARQSAQAVNARAYTVGRHIVFGTERYSPETDSGRLLLAHELAHVIQQRAARPIGTEHPIDGCPGHPVHGAARVTHVAHGLIQRVPFISNTEFKRLECEAKGVPCPQGIVYPKVCRLIDCIPAATAGLPFAISPGICIFECRDGSMCTCVLVGTRRHAVCTFRFCTSPGQAANTRDVAEQARLAMSQAGQEAGSPTAGKRQEETAPV